MNELERLIKQYTDDISNLKISIDSFKNNLLFLDLDKDLLNQLNTSIIDNLESNIDNLEIEDDKLKQIKESITFYKFNKEKGVDFSLLLRIDSKINNFLNNIRYLYEKIVAYQDIKLSELKVQLHEKEVYKKNLLMVKEILSNNQAINISNFNSLLQELKLNDNFKIELIKIALQINVNLGIENQDDVEQNLLALLNKNSAKRDDVDVDSNRRIYGVKPISDQKDEDLKNKIGVLISDIEELKENIIINAKDDHNLYNLLSELNELFEKVEALKTDFLSNYIVYKELATDISEIKELEREFKSLLGNYYKYSNKYKEIKSRFVKKNENTSNDYIEEDKIEEIKRQITNWDRCRSFIVPNSVYNDFISTLTEKTLEESTILTFIDAFKDLLTIKVLMQLDGNKCEKLYDLEVFEYRVTKGSDSGAVRIYFSYADSDLIILKVLFKDSDKKTKEVEKKLKKVNINSLIKQNKEFKEEMTNKMIEAVLVKYKSVLEKEKEGEEINDRENTSKL